MSLRQHLEALPQELYDEVFKLTFTFDPERETRQRFVSVLGPTPIFPALLHVNRHTRELFAKAYYGVPDGFAFHDVPPSVFRLWMNTLPMDHEDLIRRVTVKLQPESAYHSQYWSTIGLYRHPAPTDPKILWQRLVIVQKERKSTELVGKQQTWTAKSSITAIEVQGSEVATGTVASAV